MVTEYDIQPCDLILRFSFVQHAVEANMCPELSHLHTSVVLQRSRIKILSIYILILTQIHSEIFQKQLDSFI